MYLFRRLAVLLAIVLPAVPTVLAEGPNLSSPYSAQDQTQSSSSSQAGQGGNEPQQSGETPGQISVQQRIGQRRAQRRATAIHDAYDHKWQIDGGMGYLRFQPGPDLQRLTFYAWEVGATKFRSERLGFMLDGRGYYGHAFVGLNQFSQGAFTRPEISMYNVLGGPVYRFYLQPRFAISGRVLGGWAYGNFGGDISVGTPQQVGLYANGNTYAASASVIGEYNISPSISLKLAPEYFFTGFGSTVQASRGFTAGLVVRFGKQ
jgi:hypothetical protein